MSRTTESVEWSHVYTVKIEEVVKVEIVVEKVEIIKFHGHTLG